MSWIRSNKWLMIMILLLVLSIGWAVYSVIVHTSDTSTNSGFSGMRQNGSFGSGGSRPDGSFTGRSSEFGRGGSSSRNDAGITQVPRGSDGASTSDGTDRNPRADSPEGRPGQGITGSPNIDTGRNGESGERPGMPQGGGSRFGAGEASGSGSTELLLYALLFFGAAAAAIPLMKRRKSEAVVRPAMIWMAIVIGLSIRIALAPQVAGHPFDLNLFRNWANAAAKGLSDFYSSSNSDYPPLYIYMLYLVGKLTSTAALSPYSTLLIKLPSMLADMVTAYLLYRIGRKYISAGIGLAAAVFYAFNPAVLINSTYWGQVDSFFTLLIICGIWFISQCKLSWAALFMAAAIMMKPQGIIFLPVLGFALLQSGSWRAWIRAMGTAAAVVIVTALPFAWGQEPLWLYKLYAGTVGEYPYASVNAFNFYSLIGANYKQASSTMLLFSYHAWGLIFIVLAVLFTCWMTLRNRNPLLAAAAALTLIALVFTFSTSMHERYLFPAAALAIVAYFQLRDQRLLWLTLGFSVTIFFNTYYIFYYSTSGGASYGAVLFLISLLNILLCGWLIKVLWNLSSSNKPAGLQAPASPALHTQVLEM
ncbi:glycosyltransferase family 39 protein [Paenibacillus sp. JX-17]|uniref:Glycosyltransferase family 39 protein n=1 Tax=Paenibacillus lacisoli TaxID=3064525 RepID=A0ABT9CF72_9BACL|nr:glycosyltransferase 87 family protein [Paenibacillus sp. JX-17]MDO7906341.1 glycosyltransferase family 39 protein [Paenibacillus sp. JX-17]